MINIAQNTVFNLKPIDAGQIRDEVKRLLIDGEQIISAFKTVRDQFIFTNKRIITIDVQGLTGTKKSYSSLPFSRVQFFSVQTPGLLELIPDCELLLTFANGYSATFEFKGSTDILSLCKAISEYVLN